LFGHLFCLLPERKGLTFPPSFEAFLNDLDHAISFVFPSEVWFCQDASNESSVLAMRSLVVV
jgi:hypothetical protein